MANAGYHYNFKSLDPRPGRAYNSIGIGAASDAAAATIAAEFANWTGAQLTSLTANRYSEYYGFGASYPVGSRETFKGLLMDNTAGVWRIRIRNVALTATRNALVALMLGTADAASGVVALGAPPYLPNTGLPAYAITQVAFAPMLPGD